jgi:ankyrin repeat protein
MSPFADLGAPSVVDTREFAQAVWRGDIAVVDAMIAAGVDVNAVAPAWTYPPLGIAVGQMRIDIVRRLIKAGADVNCDLGEGWTPLAVAIDVESDAAWQTTQQKGRETTELTELLLASGAVITDLAKVIADDYGNHKAHALMREYEVRIKGT